MEGTVQYLKGLKDRLDGAIQVVDTDGQSEETEMLVQNAFQEIDGMEFRLACNHDGSVYAEKLIRLASEFQLRVFWDRVAGCCGRMAVHRYASHVMEALINASAAALSREHGEVEGDKAERSGVLASLPDLVLRVEQEWLDHEGGFDVLLKDTYSSHVLRAYIDKMAPSPDFINAVIESRQWSWSHQSAALVLQAVFKKNPIIVDTVNLEKRFFMTAASDKIGSRTCESFVEAAALASNECFANQYHRLIRTDTLKMTRDRSANFVIQALLAACPSDSLFAVILDELSQEPQVIVDKMGILFKIMEWPVRKGRAFEKAISFLYDAFEAKTPDAKQALVTRLQCTQMGLSILALLPSYPSDLNKYIVDGFLDLTDKDLMRMSVDRTAAHCVEAFLNTAHSTISQKARSKICRKLVPCAADLAVHPAGSYVLERAFQSAPIDVKEAIANQLALARKRVQESRCGTIIMRKLAIEQYERQREEWRKSILTSDKKRSILDVLNDDSAPVKRGKTVKDY